MKPIKRLLRRWLLNIAYRAERMAYKLDASHLRRSNPPVRVDMKGLE